MSLHLRVASSLLAAVLCSFNASAEPKPFKVVYGSAPWNVDSKKLDQAYMFVRDRSTNKTVKINIEETEPDSSIFSGNFSIDFSKSSEIEVYVPPANVRASENDVVKFNQLMNSKKVSPSPTVFKEEGGKYLLDVYDTPEQAKRARKVYEDQVKKELEVKRTENIKPVPSEQALEAAMLAESAQIMARLAKEAANRESARIRLEQLEAQRMKQMREDQARLDSAARKRRIDEAKEWAEKGNVAYRKGDYKTAEVAYTKSVELDPNSKDHYFKYGVTLYRNEKFNEALVAFKIAPTDMSTDLEKKYYMGLIHYRLNEFAAAHGYFQSVKEAGHEVLSPAASFYDGVTYFNQEKYEEAQKAFEWVLDNSKDAGMDKKAEEFIEKIAAALQARREANRKWKINASAGAIYDSNILFSPDNDSATATSSADKGGLRTSLSGSADYRLMYSTTREMSVLGSTYYMYSLNKDFVAADPFLNTLALPYTLKGTIKAKGYQWTLTPGYEALFMDAESTGSRDNILNSIFGKSDLTLVMRDDWFATYTFEARKEDSNLASQAGDNELSGMKYTLSTQQVRLLDDAKKRALIFSGGFIMNDADGKNRVYNRIDLGVIYSAPWKQHKDTTWNAGVALYKMDFSDSSDDRSDTDMAFSLGMDRVINERWSWSAISNYTNNASTVDANQYSKYSLTGTLNYNWQD
jgi:tetratricopeptide (TPR) repeat protein